MNNELTTPIQWNFLGVADIHFKFLATKFIYIGSGHSLIVGLNDEVNLTKGTRVRIHGGQFNGLEGTFVKVKGARDKRVVVDISGVIVVATCTLKCDLVEVIKDTEPTV